MIQFYFVRHGESVANAKGLFAGSSDVPLTEKGVQQAHAVAESIVNGAVRFDAIYASPLVRAFDTAKIITQAIEYPLEKVIVLPDLRERSAGELELATVSAVYDVSEEDMIAYGGETAEAFRDRAAAVFDHIRQESTDRNTVLIVAHAGMYKMAVALNEDIQPATAAYQIPPPPNATLLPFPI